MQPTTYASTAPPWFSFLGACGQPGAPVGVLGVPYDGGNSVASGTRGGPEALRAASRELPSDLAEAITDFGDLAIVAGEDPASVLAHLADAWHDLDARCGLPLLLGGDHSLTFAPIERLQRRGPLAVLWLDAHTDFNPWDGTGAHDHKQVLRRICRLPGVVYVLHIGHRGFTIDDERDLGAPLEILGFRKLRRLGVERACRRLPREVPCYVSLDIDVLDPAWAPGTSTPVPGGLTPEAIAAILRTTIAARRVVGLDLVEVNPGRDVNGLSACVGAWMFAEAILAFIRKPASSRA